MPKVETMDEIMFDLEEIAHYLGGWDELRKLIDDLENSDDEAAYERAYRGEK
jgi:hypothetical protein